MPVLGSCHVAAAGELREWWEDLWEQAIGSQVLLLKVPPGWGRSRVLDQVAEDVNSEGAPVTVVVRIRGRDLPDERGQQAEQIRRWLSGEQAWRRLAELFDVDRPSGALQQALDVLGAGIPGAGVPALVASKTVGLLRKLSERSPADNEREGSTAGVEGTVARAARALDAGVVARAARAVAEVSRRAPVVVLIDDAERLDLGQAVVLLENLMFCRDGQVLAVVAADPGSELASALRAGARVSLAGVVHTVDVEEDQKDMRYAARSALAREVCPGLSEAVIRRIAERTRTFHDVFEVTGSERLADILPGDDPRDMLKVADAVIDTELQRGPPSAEAVMVAWAGGAAHPRQVSAALAVTGDKPPGVDPDLVRSESVVRLADPGPSRFTAPIIALPEPRRRAMATAVLGQAAEIDADPASGLVDRVVAGRAAHHVRRDLGEVPGLSLVRVQRVLVADLEAAGDLTAAYKIATKALKRCPRGRPYKKDRQWLEAAELRLASTQPMGEQDPLVTELTDEAARGGAAMGLEARVWAAVNLLGMPGRGEQALRLIDQVTTELDSRGDLGDSAVDWRLQLAFCAGRAGYPSAAQPLLAALLSSRDHDLQDAAMRVLRAIEDPHADDRLQIEILEAELRIELSDDDLLRLHAALSRTYGKVGDYRHALQHAQVEVPLRQRLQGAEHPHTLTARYYLGRWTGLAGDAARARDQFAALLPIVVQVLGPEHPDTLAVRGNLAEWTGLAGDAAGARDQYAALLPIRERVSGAEHRETLAVRANLSYITGLAGDAAEARDQFAALLPIVVQVLGPEHPDTLTVRGNLAYWTGAAGDAAGARDQNAALLPIRERVSGAEHPDTLNVRGNLARFTGLAGDAVGARDQYAALLPIRERVSGAEHPDTLTVRANLAFYTGALGDAAGACDEYAALLPIEERVLGPKHPDTLAIRVNLAHWTEKAEGGAASGAD